MSNPFLITLSLLIVTNLYILFNYCFGTIYSKTRPKTVQFCDIIYGGLITAKNM